MLHVVTLALLRLVVDDDDGGHEVEQLTGPGHEQVLSVLGSVVAVRPVEHQLARRRVQIQFLSFRRRVKFFCGTLDVHFDGIRTDVHRLLGAARALDLVASAGGGRDRVVEAGIFLGGLRSRDVEGGLLVVDVPQLAEALDFESLLGVHPVGVLQLDHVAEVLDDVIERLRRSEVQQDALVDRLVVVVDDLDDATFPGT